MNGWLLPKPGDWSNDFATELMNTFLSEELQNLKNEYELFAKEHLMPVADALACQQASLPEFIKQIAQAGYLGITVPKEYGGQGGTFLSQVLLIEALSFYEPGLALSLAGQTVIIELLKQFGTDNQKSRYLPLLARGEYLGALAYVEDEHREALTGTKTVVKNVGDQKNAISPATGKAIAGTKQAVINGRLASLFVVLAKEETQGDSGENVVKAGKMPALPGECGVSTLPGKIVAGGTPALPGEAVAAGASGLAGEASGQRLGLWLVDRGRQAEDSSSRIECRQNQKGSPIGLCSTHIDEVQFNNCLVTDEDRLGSGLDAAAKDSIWQDQINFAQNINKTILAAAAVGLTEGALARSADYARKEKHLGLPLANSQAVQWKIADLAVESSAARLLTYRAAWSKDESSEDFSKYAAMCKSFAARAARLHSAEALQILGANMDNPYSDLARLFKDAKMIETVAGTTEEQKVILADELSI